MGQAVEVITTANAYVNNPETDEGDKLPLGAIKYRTSSGTGRTNPCDEWAIPLGPIKRIPLIGEHVIVIKGPSWSADAGDNPGSSYYLTSCNIQGNLNIGILPQTYLRSRSAPVGQLDDLENSQGNPQTATADDPFIGETFQESDQVKPVQPYEGDTILESRWGSVMRFTSTVEKSPHPDAKKGIDLYEIKACADWEGGNGPGSPLTIITNGLKPVGGEAAYTKESNNHDDIRSKNKNI